jgi:hypothetical protein
MYVHRWPFAGGSYTICIFYYQFSHHLILVHSTYLIWKHKTRYCPASWIWLKVVSFEKSSLKSEAWRFSEKSFCTPCCALKVRAPPWLFGNKLPLIVCVPLGICFQIANSCPRWRCNFEGLSQHGDRRIFLKISAPHSLMTTYWIYLFWKAPLNTFAKPLIRTGSSPGPKIMKGTPLCHGSFCVIMELGRDQ